MFSKKIVKFPIKLVFKKCDFVCQYLINRCYLWIVFEFFFLEFYTLKS